MSRGRVEFGRGFGFGRAFPLRGRAGGRRDIAMRNDGWEVEAKRTLLDVSSFAWSDFNSCKLLYGRFPCVLKARYHSVAQWKRGWPISMGNSMSVAGQDYDNLSVAYSNSRRGEGVSIVSASPLR